MAFTRKGPVCFSADFEPVSDADEEVFILYSENQMAHTEPETSQGFRGLGYVDSHKDVLEIVFEIKYEVPTTSGTPNRKSKTPREALKTIEVELHQDKTALRSRKGDTGSVVWKASVDFAQLILAQCYSKSIRGLLDCSLLPDAHVLELGAGTGLLSIVLSPLVRQYTATDIAPLVPLIQKNLSSNLPLCNNVVVRELDWIALETALPSKRSNIFNPEERAIDLLLAVDCLYHPSLIPPFLAAIDYLAMPDRTAVLIISELRAEDVMREFLDAWLSRPAWRIWRIPSDTLGRRYVIWLGWKSLAYGVDEEKE